MKRFLLNCVAFTWITIILIIIFHSVILCKKEQLLRLDSNVHSVFLGNSTFQYGIDDAAISGTKNFALNAEPIDFMFAKLKLLKKYNSQLDTAFVELDDVVIFNKSIPPVLSHPLILEGFDMKDWRDNFETMSFERNTSYILHAYDVIKIRPLLISLIRTSSITNLGIGGYTKLDRNKLKEDLELSTNSSYIRHKDIPEQNIRYYKKLDKWCQQNNVTLIFLNNPMHKSTWCDTTYRRIYSEYFTHIPFLDNTHLELPDSCFADRAHLNTTGARIYSDFLRKQIQSLHISE